MPLLRLDLGSSNLDLEGYTSVDIVPPCNVVADLTQRWPWEDSTVDEIRAHDIIEHLPDKIHTMNEAWRVLKPGSVMHVKVPTTDGPGAWCDPQHNSYWNRYSFEYYTDGNPAYERFHVAYGIQACFTVVNEKTWKWRDVVILDIWLKAVK